MIFSLLAFLCLVISICIKDRKHSLFIQSLNCLFESIYNFFLCAYTGAVLGFINFIRSFLYLNKNKIHNYIYIFLLFLFEGVIVANCILTWHGFISILPTFASMIRTYCLWQTNMTLVRLSGITTGIFYGAYYVYYDSWIMVLGDIILIITGLYAVFKNDILLKNSK